MVSKLLVTLLVTATLGAGCSLVEDIFGPKDGPSTPAFTAEWKNELTLKMSANSKKLRDEFFEIEIYTPQEGAWVGIDHDGKSWPITISLGWADSLALVGRDANGFYDFSRHTEVAQALQGAGLKSSFPAVEGRPLTGWVRD